MKAFREIWEGLKFGAGVVAILAMALPLPMSAWAADIATKAPASAGLFSATYPYQSSGIFFGIYTAGTGGSVNATVPGVGSSSLTTTTGEIGGTVGYAWGQKGSPIAYTLEGDFGLTNFNGSQAGLSLQGPLSFEQRFTIFMPLSNIMNALPNLPTIGTVPPFAPLQPGVTASNIQSGLGFGIKEKDISASFQGIGANKIWRVEPVIRLVALEQLSNGTALYAYAEAAIPADGKVFGPVPGVTATLGTEYSAGVGVRW
jgi:hypothetical protein